jgi:hypothetical protein
MAPWPNAGQAIGGRSSRDSGRQISVFDEVVRMPGVEARPLDNGTSVAPVSEQTALRFWERLTGSGAV